MENFSQDRLDYLKLYLMNRGEQLVISIEANIPEYFALVGRQSVEAIFEFILLEDILSNSSINSKTQTDEKIKTELHSYSIKKGLSNRVVSVLMRRIPLHSLLHLIDRLKLVPLIRVEEANIIREFGNYAVHVSRGEIDFFGECKAILFNLFNWFWSIHLGKPEIYLNLISKLQNRLEEKTNRKTLEELLELNKAIKNEVAKIGNEFSNVGAKLDELKISITGLTGSFEEHKKEQVELLYDLLDKITLDSKDEILNYYSEVEKWLPDCTEKLEKSGKTLSYLASGEYLYNKFSNEEQEDYSPCVIQFCRAVESELYHQIFNSFKEFLNTENSSTQIEKLFNYAEFLIEEKGVVDKRGNAPSSLIYGLKKHFMFGNMTTALSNLQIEGINQIPLFNKFKNFIDEKFILSEITNSSFIGQFRSINEIRNRAAHTYGELVNKKEAIQCKKKIQKILQKWSDIQK